MPVEQGIVGEQNVLMNCFWAEGHRDLASSQTNHTTSEKGLRGEERNMQRQNRRGQTKEIKI